MSTNQEQQRSIARLSSLERAKVRLIIQASKRSATREDIRALQSVIQANRTLPREFETYISANQRNLQLTADEESRLFHNVWKAVGGSLETHRRPLGVVRVGEPMIGGRQTAGTAATGPSTVPRLTSPLARAASNVSSVTSEIIPYEEPVRESPRRVESAEETNVSRTATGAVRRPGRVSMETVSGSRNQASRISGRASLERISGSGAQASGSGRESPLARISPETLPWQGRSTTNRAREKFMEENEDALICDFPPCTCACFGGPENRDCKVKCDCFGRSINRQYKMRFNCFGKSGSTNDGVTSVRKTGSRARRRTDQNWLGDVELV